MILKEGAKTFGERDSHFMETIRTFDKKFDDADDIPAERSHMVTTVDEKLDHVWSVLDRAINVDFQIECTNTEARADIILPDGKIFRAGVPATALLNIQGYLKELQLLYNKIPTLTPEYKWSPDENENGVHRAEPKVVFKTKKAPKNFVKFEPTEHQPGQSEILYEDIKTHDVTTQIRSGMWTPKRKSDVLRKIQTLLDAVAEALSEANRTPVPKVEMIAESLRKFIED